MTPLLLWFLLCMWHAVPKIDWVVIPSRRDLRLGFPGLPRCLRTFTGHQSERCHIQHGERALSASLARVLWRRLSESHQGSATRERERITELNSSSLRE